MGTEQVHSSAYYHTQTSGQTEHINAILEQALQVYVDYQHQTGSDCYLLQSPVITIQCTDIFNSFSPVTMH